MQLKFGDYYKTVRGTASGVQRTMKTVVVVGGGISGLAAAWRLSQRARQLQVNWSSFPAWTTRCLVQEHRLYILCHTGSIGGG